MQSRTSGTNFPIDKSTTNCSTESSRKESNYEIKSCGNDEDTFKNKSVSNSGYNETADADTESVCSTAITIKRNSFLKSTKCCQSKTAICQRLRWIFSEL